MVIISSHQPQEDLKAQAYCLLTKKPQACIPEAFLSLVSFLPYLLNDCIIQ
jgi:hypothetical protein